MNKVTSIVRDDKKNSMKSMLTIKTKFGMFLHPNNLITNYHHGTMESGMENHLSK